MELGMIGLGRMGTNMMRRLLHAGHQCVVYDIHPAAVQVLVKERAVGATSLAELVRGLSKPRAIWMMVPAAAVDATMNTLVPLLERDDVVIDGGNSYYLEDIRRTAEQGYLHCGPNGAWHFVKMVHNGIEYGLMAAYAEGLAILRTANVGTQQDAIDAETTPLRDPQHYQYDFPLAEIAEVWRRGSVIASWLLDLTAAALLKDPALADFAGRVSDSGEGRWTIKAAIDVAVPAPVLTTALYERFSSRGGADFQDRLLSALRYQFGGHQEKPAK